MQRISAALVTIFALFAIASCKNNEQKEKQIAAQNNKTDYYTEPYRPQFHFSPEEKWMNDPNGMVFHNGIYHLFYQYYPDDIVWGPMHWGHATSTDLVHWKHKPIALYPDKLGLIFSGSAVVDKNNTSGFGTAENPPLVAIFTYHLMQGEKAGRTDFQTQGIAYSLDNGDTWTKYEGNPVVNNDGIKDFRDPKVFWHEEKGTWVMSLVAGDHLQLWNSTDLKKWTKLSEFGKDQGAHGGVWECPDLFPLQIEGTEQEKWVLLISINPGAPNGGSGTQYFIGDFDGIKFTTDQKEERWLDWGTDNYAGVTYSNEPNDETIFIGWMSNWSYARDTPTERWRSAMTVPRKITLKKVGNEYSLFSMPVESLDIIIEKNTERDITIASAAQEKLSYELLNQSEIRFTTSSKDFNLKFSNSFSEELLLTMKGEEETFFLDRSKSGKVDFQQDFGKGVQQMPTSDLPEGNYEVRILMDWSSVEIFINKGQYAMTAQLFPNKHYTDLTIENLAQEKLVFKDFELNEIKEIW